MRRGADPARIFSIAFSRGPIPEYVAVSSDKGTVHVFTLDAKRTEAIPTTEETSGDTDASKHKNPVSALSFVSVSPLHFSLHVFVDGVMCQWSVPWLSSCANTVHSRVGTSVILDCWILLSNPWCLQRDNCNMTWHVLWFTEYTAGCSCFSVVNAVLAVCAVSVLLMVHGAIDVCLANNTSSQMPSALSHAPQPLLCYECLGCMLQLIPGQNAAMCHKMSFESCFKQSVSAAVFPSSTVLCIRAVICPVPAT